MHTLALPLTLAGLALASCLGCSKPATRPDTTPVEAAFSTVATVEKAEVQRALNALKAGDYPAATAALKQAAASVRLTPAQQRALKDLQAQVEARLAADASRLAQTAKGAADSAAQPAGAGQGAGASKPAGAR